MATNTQESGLFDWAVMEDTSAVRAEYAVFDETLRDGIQAPYVPNPSLEVKLGLVDLMVRAGVRAADLGFPGASAEARRDCTALAKHCALFWTRLCAVTMSRPSADNERKTCQPEREELMLT